MLRGSPIFQGGSRTALLGERVIVGLAITRDHYRRYFGGTCGSSIGERKTLPTYQQYCNRAELGERPAERLGTSQLFDDDNDDDNDDDDDNAAKLPRDTHPGLGSFHPTLTVSNRCRDVFNNMFVSLEFITLFGVHKQLRRQISFSAQEGVRLCTRGPYRVILSFCFFRRTTLLLSLLQPRQTGEKSRAEVVAKQTVFLMYGPHLLFEPRLCDIPCSSVIQP